MIRPFTLLLCLGTLSTAIAQDLLSSGGGAGTAGALHVEHSIGEPFTGTVLNGGVELTQGMEQPTVVRVRLDIRALLQGPYDIGNMLMTDGLRLNGLIPLSEPYSAMDFPHAGGETVDASVLAAVGNTAVVDWILLELRDPVDPTVAVASRAALLLRNGTVVDLDGSSSVAFKAPAGDYYITVYHRNHLAVMTQLPVTLSRTPLFLDLTDGSTATYGTEAQHDQAGTRMLWAGDVNADGFVKYTGETNDRDPILQAIGGTSPTSTIAAYAQEDVNMDGTVKYTGANNDRDPILMNIGGTAVTNIRTGQIP